jgi:hypothetical protein
MSDPLSASEIRERATQYMQHLRNCDLGRCLNCSSWYEHEQNLASGKCDRSKCTCGLDELLALLASRETPRQDEAWIANEAEHLASMRENYGLDNYIAAIESSLKEAYARGRETPQEPRQPEATDEDIREAAKG